MKEQLLGPPDRRIVESLSRDTLIDEAAKWIVDPSFDVAYMPDFGLLAYYMDETYGVTEDQVSRALAIAEARHIEVLGHGQA